MKTFVLFASLLVAACGPKPSTSTTTSTGGGTAGVGAGSAEAVKPPLPNVPFDSLDHEQRIQFMKEKVMPTMEPLF